MKNKGLLFSVHWIAAWLLLVLIYKCIRSFFNKRDNSAEQQRLFTWAITASAIFVLSIELYQLTIWTQYLNQESWIWWKNLYYKAGLSILWSCCSFAMMLLGMKKDFQPLRVVSLTLFAVTLIKLFVYDIRNIPPGGKIAAFILLGALLLAVSFMYQRLKKLLTDNHKNTHDHL